MPLRTTSKNGFSASKTAYSAFLINNSGCPVAAQCSTGIECCDATIGNVCPNKMGGVRLYVQGGSRSAERALTTWCCQQSPLPAPFMPPATRIHLPVNSPVAETEEDLTTRSFSSLYKPQIDRAPVSRTLPIFVK